MKIHELKIRGIRGIKKEICVKLDGKSILLFGDNASGKSSITDAIEWIYHDKVKHLSTEEIDRRGVSALRNINLPDLEDAEVLIKFSMDGSIAKKLKNNLKAEMNISNSLGHQYIENSRKENLILRYADLTEFVLASKTEKLKALSTIIGFDDVTKYKDILKKGLNHIKSKRKSKNFDNEINRRKGNILEVLGESITSDEHFIQKINELIADLNLSKRVQTISDIDVLLRELKEADDSPIVKERTYLKDIINKLSDFKGRLKIIYKYYIQYVTSVQEIKENIEELKNLVLINLLEEGVKVLSSENLWWENLCPLCNQEKNKEELMNDLRQRLDNLKLLKEKQEKLKYISQEMKNMLNKEINSIQAIINKDEYFKNNIKQNLQRFIDVLIYFRKCIERELNKDIVRFEIKTVDEIKLQDSELTKALDFCEQRYNALGKKLKGQKVLEIQDKIIRSEKDYNEIKNLEKEKKILEKIGNALEKIYNTFVQRQKTEIEHFLANFSHEIKNYYEAMHPDETIKDISIVSITDEDELKGITLEYEFFATKVSPPQKYLSESHLNSLGIAFFLASVRVFNKINKFLILDDIMSSFDIDHRARLSHLLLDKFRDYQLIILTHEKGW